MISMKRFNFVFRVMVMTENGLIVFAFHLYHSFTRQVLPLQPPPLGASRNLSLTRTILILSCFCKYSRILSASAISAIESTTDIARTISFTHAALPPPLSWAFSTTRVIRLSFLGIVTFKTCKKKSAKSWAENNNHQPNKIQNRVYIVVFVRIRATGNQFGLDELNLFVLLLVFLDHFVKTRFGASSFHVELNGVSVRLLCHGIYGNAVPNIDNNRLIRRDPSLFLAEDNLQLDPWVSYAELWIFWSNKAHVKG